MASIRLMEKCMQTFKILAFMILMLINLFYQTNILFLLNYSFHHLTKYYIKIEFFL